MKRPKNTTKKLDQKGDAHTQEVKRYVGIISEDFQHGLSAIGEQLGGLNNKIDHIAEVQSEHTRKLDNHAMMIARVMEDVEEIKSGMREKVDRSEFVKLEKRMVVLETTVFGGKKKILSK